MSLADLLTFGFYSEEEGAIAEQFNTLFVHLILIQVTYNIQNDHTFTTVYIYCHVCFNIIHTSSLNMCPLLSLLLCTYYCQQDMGGDGDEQGEENIDG